eukprot:12180082-Ditylum_brightwellii.AAC.1
MTIVTTVLIIVDVRSFLNKVIIQIRAIPTTLASKRAMDVRLPFHILPFLCSVWLNLQTTHKSLDGGTLCTHARQNIGQDGS